MSWTWAIGDSPTCPWVWNMCSHLLSLLPEAAPKTQPWDRNVVKRLSGLCTWLNPVRASVHFYDLVGGCRKLFILQPPKTILICKLPCLLNLPLTNLEWSAFFFGLSLPSMYGGQFQITPGRLPKRWRPNSMHPGHAAQCTTPARSSVSKGAFDLWLYLAFL